MSTPGTTIRRRAFLNTRGGSGRRGLPRVGTGVLLAPLSQRTLCCVTVK